VLERDTEESLAERILAEEHRLYPQALRLLAEDRLRVEGRMVNILPPRSTVAASPKGAQ
jgi:phosphoribosylglycinamide formyltransferase-1